MQQYNASHVIIYHDNDRFKIENIYPDATGGKYLQDESCAGKKTTLTSKPGLFPFALNE
jgi:hypothetical protein